MPIPLSMVHQLHMQAERFEHRPALWSRHGGAYVPTSWRDYAREARSLAQQGRVADAAGRLAQMLKLAAVYRAFGGLENTVQSEEIRYLAGLTAEAARQRSDR